MDFLRKRRSCLQGKLLEGISETLHVDGVIVEVSLCGLKKDHEDVTQNPTVSKLCDRICE